MAYKVIDISHHQGSYNAKQAVANGVKDVVCRTNYGTTKDTKVNAFALNALDAGQSLWGYGFATWHYDSVNGKSFAKAQTCMQQQAAKWVEEAKSNGMAGYFVLDQELESGKTMSLTRSQNTQLINECMALIADAGFEPVLYASVSWLLSRLNMNQFTGKVWVARYYWDPNDGDFEQRDPDVSKLKAGQYTDLMVQLKNAGRLVAWQWGRIGYGSKYGVGSANVDKNWFYMRPEESSAATGSVTVSEEPRFITIGPASKGDAATITAELDRLCINWDFGPAGEIVTRVDCSAGDQANFLQMAVSLALPIKLTKTWPLAVEDESDELEEGYTVIFMAAVVKGGFASEADAKDYIEMALGKDTMEKYGIEVKMVA